MDIDKVNELKRQANVISNETEESANSAPRVGGLLYEMIEADAEAISNLETNVRNINSSIDLLDNAIQELSENIGEGTGGGDGGYQLIFYINIPCGITPRIPSTSDFDKDTMSFKTHGESEEDIQEWVTSNDDPEEGEEDTWQLSAWFVGTTPIDPMSITKIYDGTIKGSSNGEDRKDEEFIYYRTNIKLKGAAFNAMRDFLSECKVNGSKNYPQYIENGKTSFEEADAVPQHWSDRAQGIDEDNKYEYRSSRKPSFENNQIVWGKTGFAEPILISAYGEKGEDGDGVEYIFLASQTSTFPTKIVNGQDINNPQNWNSSTTGRNGKTFQDNEFIADDSDWLDNPIDLDVDSNYGPGSREWVSIRKKRTVTETIIDNGQEKQVEVYKWLPFSPPALWSGIGKDSLVEGYTVDLVNENMPVVVDANGNIVSSSYTNQARIQVKHNGAGLGYKPENEFNSAVDTDYFSYRVATNGVKYSDDRPYYGNTGDNRDPIHYDINGANFDVSISSSLQNFNGTTCNITLEVLLPGTNNISILICTIYGIHIDGIENVDMYVGAPCIHADSAGKNPNPSSLPIGVKIGKSRSNTTTYLSGDTNSANGSAEDQGFIFSYYFDDSGSYITYPTYSGGNVPLPSNDSHFAVTVEMRYGHVNDWIHATFIDRERIPYVKDGASNGQGSRGIVSTTSYYKASNVDPINQNSWPSAPTSQPNNGSAQGGWYLSPMLAGWGNNAPYLYRCDLTVYNDSQNGEGEWGDVKYDRLWIEPASNSGSSYSLIVNPAYGIFEEPVTVTMTSGIASYTVGTVDYANWIAKVQLLKIDDTNNTIAVPQVIGYSLDNGQQQGNGEIHGTNCSFHIVPNSDNTELSINITDISSGVTTGNIYFILTVNINGTFKAYCTINIPIYINRVGSRTQQIAGDIESTIMNKEIYHPDGSDSVYTLQNLGNYLRTSDTNLTQLSSTINGIQKDASNALQTAEQISFSVNNGWYNYIKNPLAIDGTLETCDSQSIQTSSTVGQYRLISNSDGNNWQLLHTLKDDYTELAGQYVTWFCVVKNTSKDSGDRLYFGSGDGSSGTLNTILRMKYVNNTITAEFPSDSTIASNSSIFNIIKVESVAVGGEWYICRCTLKMKPNVNIVPAAQAGQQPVKRAAFNSMQGTWWIYYAGIIKGDGRPSLDMIMYGDGFQRAGIDITHGSITSRGENFKWENDNGQQILGLNADGDAEFTGIIRAKTFYHDVCIVGYNMWRKYEKEARIQVLPTVDLQGKPTGQTSLIISEDEYSEDVQIVCSTANEANAKKVEAEEFYSKLIIGNYYDKETLNSDYFDHSLFSEECTGNCDVVIIPSSAQGAIVTLPKPEDFEGKIIEIYDYTYSQSNSTPTEYHVVTLDNSRFTYGITLATNPTRPSVYDNATITNVPVDGGQPSKFYSIKMTNEAMTHYWVRIQ